MSVATEFIKGIYKENPVFRLALGLCPVLAVSTSIFNAIGMGAATTFVLLSSNVIVSLLILLFSKILSEDGQKSINKIPTFDLIHVHRDLDEIVGVEVHEGAQPHVVGRGVPVHVGRVIQDAALDSANVHRHLAARAHIEFLVPTVYQRTYR